MAFAGFVRKAAAAAFVVAVAAVLSSCGGGGDLPTPQIDSQRASAQAQLTALRSAHGEAVRALARLKTGTGAATRAEIAAAEAAVRALDAALAAAVDVAGADRARYGSTQLKADLAAVKAEARENIRGQEDERRRQRQAAAVDAAAEALSDASERLRSLGDNASYAEITDVETALAYLETQITAAADWSDDAKDSWRAPLAGVRPRLSRQRAALLARTRARDSSRNFRPRERGWSYGPAWQHKSPAIDDLSRVSSRGGIEIRSGRWRDRQGRDGSVSAARLAEYFNSVARVELREEGDVIRARDFGSYRRVRVNDNATSEQRAALDRAIQNINEVLPYEKELRRGSDIPRLIGPISGDDLYDSLKDGEIHIHFTDGQRNWPYDWDNYDAAGFGGVQTTCLDQDCLQTRIKTGYALIDWSTRNDKDDLVTHELLHALGISGHVEVSRFPDAILAHQNQDGTTLDVSSTVEGKVLLAIATNRVANGTRWADVTPSSFGNWERDAFHLLGWADTGNGSGDIQFGVSWANGLATPWAFGHARPTRRLQDNAAFGGRATWNGVLLAVDTKGEGSGRTVAGDTEISIEFSSLQGRADFTGLESWSPGSHPGTAANGEIWGDGDLGYSIEVRNQGDLQFFSSTNVSSADDPGVVSGLFVGTSHQGTTGTLEHPGLIGAFGALRE